MNHPSLKDQVSYIFFGQPHSSLPSGGSRWNEVNEAVALIEDKQREARQEDWLWFGDALMDRRIGADAALREFEQTKLLNPSLDREEQDK